MQGGRGARELSVGVYALFHKPEKLEYRGFWANIGKRRSITHFRDQPKSGGMRKSSSEYSGNHLCKNLTVDTSASAEVYPFREERRGQERRGGSRRLELGLRDFRSRTARNY